MTVFGESQVEFNFTCRELQESYFSKLLFLCKDHPYNVTHANLRLKPIIVKYFESVSSHRDISLWNSWKAFRITPRRKSSTSFFSTSRSGWGVGLDEMIVSTSASAVPAHYYFQTWAPDIKDKNVLSSLNCCSLRHIAGKNRSLRQGRFNAWWLASGHWTVNFEMGWHSLY